MSIFDRFRLDGRRALITGATRGLGRAMAQALAEAGADLVLAGRDLGALDQTGQELTALGHRVAGVQADVGNPQRAERMCDVVLKKHGPIDILINNVGGRRDKVSFLEQPLTDWQRLFDLNLTSAVVCTQRLAPGMLERGWGRVINIASICGQIATRNIGGRHYESAKAALVGLTRALAADWAPRGVTVNAIAPGGFMTDANRRWFGERPEFQKEVESLIPMGRLGNPEELGPLAVYLASDASNYMTGAVLTIDGGYTLW
ncbi:MAG: SDR family oxidoreductase [Planctomycetes bacterium]|nr:SDR family oxidoreductase [Planctomycetota bacterium]